MRQPSNLPFPFPTSPNLDLPPLRLRALCQLRARPYARREKVGKGVASTVQREATAPSVRLLPPPLP